MSGAIFRNERKSVNQNMKDAVQDNRNCCQQIKCENSGFYFLPVFRYRQPEFMYIK